MSGKIPIVSVVGYSNSGKTTYLEKLIPELKTRGYSVCAVKHDVHEFDIDVPGKDSHRLKAAGAHTTLISSPSRVAVISDVERDMTLSELRDRFIIGVDIIITEGYKSDIHPKIEVFRDGLRDDLLCRGDYTLFAVAANVKVETDVPVVSIDDAGRMADLIEEHFLKNDRR
jgi:molybdopterin-guanine dinucleotide biosynthesis protein MobB